MDKVAELFSKLAEQYGPNVVEAAKGAARVEAYSYLTGTVITASISVALFCVGKSLWKVDSSGKNTTYSNIDDEISHGFGIALMLLSTIPALISLWHWIDPWTWTAINYPELYIAKRVLKL